MHIIQHSLLQTQAWADFKVNQGWLLHSIDLAGQDQPVRVLERDLAFGKTMLYAPEVVLSSEAAQQLDQFAQQLHEKAPQAIFFRLELLMPFGETENSLTAQLTNANYRKSFEEVQPEHRQWLDISKDETTIISSMKEKGRYNVRLSERKGVVTRVSTNTKDVEVFYDLFKYTADRDRFTIRSLSYFQSLCAMLFEQKLGELIIAEKDGEPLAAMIVTYHEGMASYLYGASGNTHRNLMAPYAAHMAAIRAAKEHDCAVYDLLQIAPLNANTDHHYANLTRFKQQFGGERVDLIGSWDFVYSSLWYQAFKLAEQARRH
jgi:lipid II:glycine glycyltransferase (peptidoglycan interpeptide bridge formation enzyme)